MARIGSQLGKQNARGDFFVVPRSRRDLQHFALAGQWRERAEALQAQAPYVAAKATLEFMLGRLPKSPEWREYRESLRVVRVGRPSSRMFAVQSQGSRGRKDKVIDEETEVLYVRPKKRRLVRARPEVKVLAQHSPWTLKTLPFSPKPDEADIVVRKVTKREAKRVAELRTKEMPKWQADLQKTGVRYQRPENPQALTDVKKMPDLAFSALRLEYGYGGVKAVPHWRPGLREAVRLIAKLFSRKSQYTEALLNPQARGWRRWPPRTNAGIKISSLKNFLKFQKRLKIRV